MSERRYYVRGFQDSYDVINANTGEPVSQGKSYHAALSEAEARNRGSYREALLPMMWEWDVVLP